MKKLFIITISILISNSLWLSGQAQYLDYKLMSARIESFGRSYPSLCKTRSIVKSAGGRDIWLITIGTGDTDNKPGITITGGTEGSHILGTMLALGVAEKLIENRDSSRIKKLLEEVTFYILPDVSPDATEQYFSGMKYERHVNSRPVDDDRDFLIDEDPCEDLNGDGLITLIRIKDPSGTYIENSEDKRIMTPADLSKGETGQYLVYSEGIDNDGDERFNEDGPGGVNFNRNFSFDYEEFGSGSGLYPVSEPETKAVADFLFDRFNIYAVFSFGPQDNLGQPMKAPESPGEAQGRQEGSGRRERGPVTSIMKSDEVVNKLVSDKYHELTGLKGAPSAGPAHGNFMEWAYFHYGRYSFGTPGWWFPVEKGKSREVAFLKFADRNNMKDVFIPWTKIDHPGFPGKEVEVGGIRPFVMDNPPADSVGNLIDSHFRFISAVAEMHPALEFLDVTTENAGGDLFRLSLKVHNRGTFATCTAIGDQLLWTRIPGLSLDLSKNQTIESGTKVQRISRLQGGECSEYNWLIRGKGRVGINAGAVNTGFVNSTVDLK
ncbi:MAG: M14 family metallopeptidase [Bacteroidales bacterium]